MIICLSDTFRKSFLFSIVVIALTKDCLADRCDCNLPDSHYKELGCKPIFEKPGDCCPNRYDCSEAIKLSGEPGKCYFNGKQYSEGDRIDSSLTEPNCIAAVVCRKDTWRDFIYAQIDCAEFFGPRLVEGCFRKYKLGGCCSIGNVCPPFPKDLATCKSGEKTVYEGERFYPEGEKMLSCVCQKGYEGKNIAPFCRTITCGNGLKSLELRRGDIPIYFGEGGGCPIGWIRKEEGKYEKVGRKLEGEPDEKSCRFGNRVFNLGDKFKVEHQYASSPEVNCECMLPPLMTCYQKRQD